MSFLDNFKSGNLVLPSALLFHYKDIFKSADDFVIWQFIYLQNTTKMEDLAPSQIAAALNKTVAEVNSTISDLTAQGLLDMKTIDLGNEIEVLFDASPVLSRLDQLQDQANTTPEKQASDNPIKTLVEDFERELGRMLSPFELEDLQQTIREDQVDPDLVREALREAVFNGKTNWRYITAILRNWRREGITTVRQVEENRKEREGGKTNKVFVSDDFLSAMDLWSDS